MEILILIIKSLITYFLLIVVCSNIIGMIVRGIINIESLNKKSNLILTFIFMLIAILLIFLLYRFINFGIAISAILLMISRIPDLLNEIKTGSKTSIYNIPKGPIHSIMTILYWGALVLIFYSFWKL